ncbi:MAG: secretin N-terminal domain-containing protein, partial [Sedimentisphaerales bacterium]|nr:secretin N-terminal domain-containing protein [Sedimentisphaerales bacterium]
KKAEEEAEKRRQKELLDPARMVCKAFTLYYISAAEAAGLVQSVLSPNGVIKASSKADSTLPTGQSISGGPGGGDSFAFNDILLVKDYPENVEAVEQLLRELDVRPKQVLVEATILAVRLNNQTEFGVRWDTLKGISFPDANLVGGGAWMQSGLKIGICKADVAVFIQALEEITDMTLLANPKILATNKQLGQVYIGTKIGYRDQATISSGMATAGEVKFLDTGTKLSFRPYIGNDGYIRMDIHPKDSTGSLTTDIYGKIPSETAVELATNILVKDGQTVVIGGLFRNQVTKSKGQVPILGDLPIVGTAFKNTSDTIARQEVIVLLTPHILEEPDVVGGQQAAEEVDRRILAADKSLIPLTQTRIVKDYYAKAVNAYLDGDMDAAMQNLDAILALQPTDLDALRLKERIIQQTSPEDYQRLERIRINQIRDQSR